MYWGNKLLLISIFAFLFLSFSKAETRDHISNQEMLAIAKFAGACGIMDSMIEFQKTTKLPGGDEFVTRFWAVESARLGQTIEQQSQNCNNAYAAYDHFWKSTEE